MLYQKVAQSVNPGTTCSDKDVGKYKFTQSYY